MEIKRRNKQMKSILSLSLSLSTKKLTSLCFPETPFSVLQHHKTKCKAPFIYTPTFSLSPFHIPSISLSLSLTPYKLTKTLEPYPISLISTALALPTMEAFSLLKFWRNAAGGGGATTSQPPAVETDDEADDEGSFIDLEFTVPDCDDKEVDNDRDGDNNSLDNDDEDQYNDSAKRDGDTKLKDLFFKARIQPIEPSSKPQSPISLLRSAPKFRVFMLGFKKSKSEKTETNGGVSMATTPKHQHPKTTPHQQQGKLFTVKFKVESEAPIVSMFTRNNSSRSNNCKLHNQSSDDASSDDSSKRFPKDVVQKYLKLIKPLYVRVSKRYGEKMRFSGQLSTATSFPSPTKGSVCSPKKPIKTTSKREEGEDKQGNLPAGLRVVCKHLGKSRSASSAVGVFPPPASRRDDSLLQQHDGIQSAILHCKRSFNSSRESTLFSRSSSEEERGTSS